MEWAQGDFDDHIIDMDLALCRESAANFLLRKGLLLAAFDKANNKLVSTTGLHRFNWKTRIFEIGYWVRTSETGKGYDMPPRLQMPSFAMHLMHYRPKKL